MKISIEDGWNDADRGKPTYSERILSHCHSVCHKWHGTDHGSNPSLRGETPAATLLNDGTVRRPDFTCDIYMYIYINKKIQSVPLSKHVPPQL